MDLSKLIYTSTIPKRTKATYMIPTIIILTTIRKTIDTRVINIISMGKQSFSTLVQWRIQGGGGGGGANPAYAPPSLIRIRLLSIVMNLITCHQRHTVVARAGLDLLYVLNITPDTWPFSIVLLSVQFVHCEFQLPSGK